MTDEEIAQELLDEERTMLEQREEEKTENTREL